MLSSLDIDHLAQVGLDAALASAEYISSQTGQKHTTFLKPGVQSLATQLVTEIDLKSQQIIIKKLAKSIRFYDLGMISEELQDDKSRFEKEYFWCIDPLDGTLPFTEQRHGYAVSIALLDKLGEPMIGIVIDPHHKKQYLAIKGNGCFINEKPYQGDKVNNDQLICHFDRSFVQSLDYNSTMIQLHQLKEKFGLNAVKVHTGAGAVMNALGLLGASYGCYIKLSKPTIRGGCIWDFAASSLIFRELGLFVSDSFGRPLMLNKKDSLYMNEEGILFATDSNLGKELIQLAKVLREPS